MRTFQGQSSLLILMNPLLDLLLDFQRLAQILSNILKKTQQIIQTIFHIQKQKKEQEKSFLQSSPLAFIVVNSTWNIITCDNNMKTFLLLLKSQDLIKFSLRLSFTKILSIYDKSSTIISQEARVYFDHRKRVKSLFLKSLRRLLSFCQQLLF